MQVLAVLLVAFAAFAAAEYTSSDDVVVLTGDNFDQVLSENENVLVEFYAPWCGHCKKLEPEYKLAASALKNEKVVLGAVDATAHPTLGSRFDVKGYPTLKFFKSGEPTDYTGGRTKDTIVNWIAKRLGPAVKTIEASAVEAFAAESKVAIVGYFASNEAAGFKALETYATSVEDLTFAAVFDLEAGKAAGLESGAGVVLYKQFDEGKNVLNGDSLTKDQVAEFVVANRMQIVMPFSLEEAAVMFQSPMGAIAFYFDDAANADFRALAEKYRGKLVFSTSSSADGRLHEFLGISPSDFPLFYIMKTGQAMVKYPMFEKVSAEAMDAHVSAFLAGSLKPHLKSEEIPKENDGEVVIVVGKNFNEVVLDESKDVFLEVYAPWCGHCKSLAPAWSKLADFFKDNKNIVIAKMDGTANEVEGLNVRGFPTLQFYPAGAGKSVETAIPHSGGRDYDALKAYVLKNAKSSSASNTKDEL